MAVYGNFEREAATLWAMGEEGVDDDGGGGEGSWLDSWGTEWAGNFYYCLQMTGCFFLRQLQGLRPLH